MRVDDKVLKSVAFIGRVLHSDSDSWDGEAVGTGFFLATKSSIEGKKFHCFVTAKHVVDGLAGCDPYIILNRKHGGREVLCLGPNVRWWFHPTDQHADVAIMPFSVQPEHDIMGIPSEEFILTEANRARYRIGVGDDVFITGLFSYATGMSRNMPIVRHGNIAMMPDEPLQTRYGFADVYLIEARSIGGLSGSPVFVRETLHIEGKDHLGESAPLTGLGRLQLLGVMHGHWDIKESEINKATFTPTPRGQGVNIGIGIVTPAVKILETINQQELVDMRKAVEDAARKSTLPVEDSIPGSTQYERFSTLAERVLAVPKDEINRREATFKAQRKNRPKRGPKPKS